MQSHRFFVVTASGLEAILQQELHAIGARHLKRVRGGVFFEGDLSLAMRANLWLRTAQRVVLPLLEFPCPDVTTLYRQARSVRWQDYILRGRTFAVDAAVFRSAIDHSHFASLKIKDAIVDSLRAHTGQRPDVDTRDPDVRILLNLRDDVAQLQLDLSGDPLFMRRYRVAQGEAPLKESLAAGLVRLSGWSGRNVLIDPLCGSGTVVIEAALLALDRAPGRHRSFGFERLPFFDAQAAQTWRALQNEADDRALARLEIPLLASDWAPEVVAAARANVEAAGLEQSIQLEVADVRDRQRWPRGGTWLSNLPYGTRVGGPQRSIEAFYRELGAIVRREPLRDVWFFTTHPQVESLIGVPASARHRLFNGPLETWFYGFARAGAGRTKGGSGARSKDSST